MAVEQITYENIDHRVRNTIMFGLALAMLAACFDGTIVGTIGPKVALELGGSDLFAWMTTTYILCETIMIPIAGKLSDIYGRKPIFLIGLTIFAVGSVIAGMSTSMEMFIACRAIQGLGGGILIPVATAAVADLYSPRERARIQGILGAIFGIGSAIGPLIGGYIQVNFSWEWCFYINIPLAIIAFALTMKKFPTPMDNGEKYIDYKGISVLTLLLLDVLLFFEFGGSKFEWVSLESAVMIVAAIVLAFVFVRIEKKARDPILAPHLARNKTVVMSAIFMAIFGIGMIGAMMYTNMFAMSEFGISTLEAGEWSIAMVVGMMITAMASGALVYKTGFRPWLIMGPIICFIGLYILSGMTITEDLMHFTIGPDGTPGLSTAEARDAYMHRYLVGIFVLGVGLGCMMSVIMTAVQNSSKPTEMGMTTSAVNLVRSIGTTMGTAIFTLIINNKLTTELADHLSPGLFDSLPHNIGILDCINPLGTKFDPMAAMEAPGIMIAFGDSINYTFLLGGCIILILAVIGVFYKVKIPEPDEDFEAAKRRVERRDE